VPNDEGEVVQLIIKDEEFTETMEITKDKAGQATRFLKTLANENRLQVLCHLAQGEKSVTELETLIGIRQPNLSQQLARLRMEGLVKTRRDVKSIYYSLDSTDVILMIQLLYSLFCLDETSESMTISRNMMELAE
jgi:ArsR family transcriptional regulator